MFICHCQAVTDERIRAAIEAGARDPAALALRCGAGARCGGCLPALRALLDSYCPGGDSGECGAQEGAAA